MKLVKMSDLFTVSYGNKLDLNKMSKSKNGVAFVNRTGFNNGVVSFVKEIEGIAPYPAKTLTIALGGSVLSTFLQINPYYTGQNVAVAIPKIPMSEAALLYYATAVKANRFRFSTCGREANRTFRSLLVPRLKDIPAWVDGSDHTMFDGANAPFTAASKTSDAPKKYGLFTLSQLFEIKKGRRLTKANMTVGVTPFIGAIDSSNGVTARIGQSPIHKGNTISVSYNGSVAEAFFQPYDYWASDDVNVLYPRFEMTAQMALYLCAVIRQEKYRYNYGRKWHLDRMRESVIRLPVCGRLNEPDWQYMDNYIKTLPYSSQIS